MSLSSEPCLFLFLYQHVLYCQLRFVSSLVEFLPFHLRWREIVPFRGSTKCRDGSRPFVILFDVIECPYCGWSLLFHAKSVRYRLHQCKGDSEHTWKENSQSSSRSGKSLDPMEPVECY